MHLPNLLSTDNIEIQDGAHILYIYSDTEKYLHHAVSFVSTGLELGHPVYFMDEIHMFRTVLERLEKKGYRKEILNTIRFADSVKFYSSMDLFPDDLQEEIHNHTALRIWRKIKLDNPPCCLEKLKTYEQEADQYVRRFKGVTICAYDGAELSANFQLEFMKDHQYVMTDSELFQSGIYLNKIPSLYIEEDCRKSVISLKNELKHMHRYYKNLLDQMPDAVFVTTNDEDIKIIYANRAAAKLMECDLHQLMGINALEIVVPEQHPIIKERLKKIPEGEEMPIIESKFITFKGNVIEAEFISFPFVFDHIKLSTSISIVRNISTRVFLQKKLSEQLDFNRIIFNSLQMGLIVVENDQVKMMNPTARKILGFNGNRRIQKIKDLFIKLKEPQKMQNAIALSELTINVETQHIDGRPIEYDVIPIYCDEGHKNYVLVIRDITYHKKIEEDLYAAKLSAEKANQKKTLFLSHISHDLRTPLNTIQGFTQILLAQNEKDAKTAYRLQKILGASNHLLELIEEILDFSAIESGIIKLQPEKIHLKSFIVDCVSSMETNYSNIKILVSPIDEGFFIRADAKRLRQILNNLLSNAIKYNKPNGSVRIHVAKADSRIVIKVIDTGIGIPKQELDLVFEPYYRGNKKADNQKGFGLGLAIVAKLAEIMNGRYGVDSEEEVGTTFWISFPSIAAGNTINTRRRTVHLKNVTAVQKRVLYIEDHRDSIELMEAMLETIGHLRFFFATTGQEGYLRAVELKPDLILLDLGLPDMHGLQVLHQLQNNEMTKHIPVVAVSADVMEVNIKKALLHGCKEFIAKPIDVHKLKNVIEKI